MDQGNERTGAEIERENSKFLSQSTLQEPRVSKKNLINVATKKEKLSTVLILVTVISCLTSLQQGYNLWILYNTIGLLPSFYNITAPEDRNFQLTLLAVTVTMFPLGASFGTIPAGWVLDRFGRKVAFFVTNLSTLMFAIVMVCSLSIHSHGYLIFSRLCCGISTGICSCVGPLYLGEISPRSRRGGIILIHQLFYLFGFLLAQILCLQELFGTGKGFPVLVKLFTAMPLLQLPLLPFLPESPRYLFIQKKDEERSRKVLKKLRNRNDVEDEMEELHQEDIVEKSENNMKLLKLLFSEKQRRQVIATIVLMVGQQLDGISVVFHYSKRIFRNENLGILESQLTLIGTTTYMCICTVFAILIVDSKGRKFPLLIGFGMSSFLCVLLTLSMEIQSAIPDIRYFSVILIYIFFFGHAIGPGPLPIVLVVELFLQSSRSSAVVIAQFFHWLTTFITGLLLLYIEVYIGPYSLVVFCPFGFAIFIYLFKFIPETRNRTFVDIRTKVINRKPKRVHFKKQLQK